MKSFKLGLRMLVLEPTHQRQVSARSSKSVLIINILEDLPNPAQFHLLTSHFP
jgi:hypothetical protein